MSDLIKCCGTYYSMQSNNIKFEPQELDRHIYINDKHNPNMQEMLYVTKEETSVYIRFRYPDYTYSRWYKNIEEEIE